MLFYYNKNINACFLLLFQFSLQILLVHVVFVTKYPTNDRVCSLMHKSLLGDVPSKANKLILNSTTEVLYNNICFEEHHADVVYDLWHHDYLGSSLIDDITHELIQYPVWPVWGQFDCMVWWWEVLLRKLLFMNCICVQKLKLKASKYVVTVQFLSTIYIFLVFSIITILFHHGLVMILHMDIS